METERHRCGTWSKRGGSQSMVQKGEDSGSASLAASAPSRQTSATEPRTDGAVARLAGTRSDGIWLPGRCLDHGARGGNDSAAVRVQLSSSPWLSPPSPPQTEPTKAHPKSDATG